MIGQYSEAFVPTAGPSIRVRSALDMARLLIGIAPEDACDTVLMQHERACDEGNADQAGFWSEVLRLIG